VLKKNKLLQLHFIVFLWGLTPVLGKLIHLNALDLVWWRLVFAAISLYIYVLIKKFAFHVSFRQLGIILVMGALVGIHWFFFYHAIKVSNVSVAMAGFSTMTLFASFLQPLLLKKKFFWGDALYGIIIFIGLGIILSFESGTLLGVIYGVLAALTGAFFGIYNGKLITKHNSSIITLLEFLGAFALISTFKAIDGTNDFIPSLEMSDFVWLLILSVLCTTLAFTMSVEIMKYFTPFTVIVTNNLEPVYGVLFSVLLFGQSEVMGNYFYMGAVIILLCVFTYPSFKRKFDKSTQI
jgi:drug/metabolite transporter (DMT)-like permease